MIQIFQRIYLFLKLNQKKKKRELSEALENEECTSFLKTEILAQRERMALLQQELLLKEEEQKKLHIEKKSHLKKENKEKKLPKRSLKKSTKSNAQHSLKEDKKNNSNQPKEKPSTNLKSAILAPPKPPPQEDKSNIEGQKLDLAVIKKPVDLPKSSSSINMDDLELIDSSSAASMDDFFSHPIFSDSSSSRQNDRSKIGLLQMQLEAAQESIVTLEKELEREREKNSKLQDSIQFTQTEVAQLFATFSDKLTILEKKLEDVQAFYHDEKLKNVCTTCFERDRDIILLPCLHFQLCNQCLTRHHFKTCPICNLAISGTLHVHLN